MVERLDLNKFKQTRQMKDVPPQRRRFFHRHNGHIIEAIEGKDIPYTENEIYTAQKQTRKLRLERPQKYHERRLLPPVPEGPLPPLRHKRKVMNPQFDKRRKTVGQKIRNVGSMIALGTTLLAGAQAAFEHRAPQSSDKIYHITDPLSQPAVEPTVTFQVKKKINLHTQPEGPNVPQPDKTSTPEKPAQPTATKTPTFEATPNSTSTPLPEKLKKKLPTKEQVSLGCGGDITDAQRISYGKNVHYLLNFPNSSSVQAIQAFLDAQNSPVAHLTFTDDCGHVKTFAQWMYDSFKARKIDVSIGIGIFLKESTLGKKGVARITHSVGNIRPISGVGYNVYPTWASSGEDVAILLGEYANDWGWGPDVPHAILHWAPWGDSNNPILYAQDVEETMDTLYSDSVTLSQREARRIAKEELAKKPKKNNIRYTQPPQNKVA